MVIRLNRVSRDLNVSISTCCVFLQKKGFTVEMNPNSKITEEQFDLLRREFQDDKDLKQQSKRLRTSLRGYNKRQKAVNLSTNSASEISITETLQSVTQNNPSAKLEVLKEEIRKSTYHQQSKDNYHERHNSEKKLSKSKHGNANEEMKHEKKFKRKRVSVRLQISVNEIRTKKVDSYIRLSVRFRRRTYTRILRGDELLFFKSNFCGLRMIPIILKEGYTFTFDVDVSNLLYKVREIPSYSEASIDVKRIKRYSVLLRINNIEFLDGYYLIWIIREGQKVNSIVPLRIPDYNSMSCLNLINKYYQDRIPRNIVIEYDDKEVIRISEPTLLSSYVRILKEGVNIHGEWWEEVQNVLKPTLKKCREKSLDRIKEEMSLKNCYLDYLAGIKNQRKVIMAYEVRENQKEDVFMFSVDIAKDKCIVIFENISYIATATKVFFVKNDNYEACINHIFDYFTNYELKYKRLSLKYNLNPPAKFYAENYYTINHNNPKIWIEKLNCLIEREMSVNRIQFNRGLHISEETNRRTGMVGEVRVNHIHNDIMKRLYYIYAYGMGVRMLERKIK